MPPQDRIEKLSVIIGILFILFLLKKYIPFVLIKYIYFFLNIIVRINFILSIHTITNDRDSNGNSPQFQELIDIYV